MKKMLICNTNSYNSKGKVKHTVSDTIADADLQRQIEFIYQKHLHLTTLRVPAVPLMVTRVHPCLHKKCP